VELRRILKVRSGTILKQANKISTLLTMMSQLLHMKDLTISERARKLSVCRDRINELVAEKVATPKLRNRDCAMYEVE
jgi:hypothetical protein